MAPTEKGLVNVDGQNFPHGLEYDLLGNTPTNPAQTSYDLGGCFDTFRAVIGFDSGQEPGFSGGAQFQVVADGSVVFSEQLTRGAPICEVSVSVSGVSSLELNTWFLPVEPLYASWGEARVFKNKDVSGVGTFPACS
jgi:NPCBM/NEW2 domain